jgi:hypothetical protein
VPSCPPPLPPPHPCTCPPATQMRTKLEAAGGKVFEQVQLSSVDVYADGVALTINGQTPAGGAPAAAAAAAGGTEGVLQGHHVQYSSTLTTRLLLDCMGHASPIVRQLRYAGDLDSLPVMFSLLVFDEQVSALHTQPASQPATRATGTHMCPGCPAPHPTPPQRWGGQLCSWR